MERARCFFHCRIFFEQAMIWSVILWPAFFRSAKHSVCKLIGCDIKIDKWLNRKARTQRYWNGWSGEMKSFASGLETPTSLFVSALLPALTHLLRSPSATYTAYLRMLLCSYETATCLPIQKFNHWISWYKCTLLNCYNCFILLFASPPKKNSPFLRQATV